LDPGKDYVRIDYKLHFYSSNEPSIDGQELHAKEIEIKSESSGNQQKITINVLGYFKYTQKISGEPPEGFNTPPPATGPSGTNLVPDSLEPTPEPDPNEPEPNPEPEAGDGTGLEADPSLEAENEVEPEPEEPEPDPEPEPEPEEPETQAEDEVNVDDVEVNDDEPEV
jgi:hypothetical protein